VWCRTIYDVFVASNALHLCVNALAIFTVVHGTHGMRISANAGHFQLALFAVVARKARSIVKSGFRLSCCGFACSGCSSRYKGGGTNQAYNESQEPMGQTIGTHLFY
jgi:hypothetical protein